MLTWRKNAHGCENEQLSNLIEAIRGALVAQGIHVARRPSTRWAAWFICETSLIQRNDVLTIYWLVHELRPS